MKKILLTLLYICVATAALAYSFEEQSNGKTIYYNIVDGYAHVTNNGEGCYSGEITIPATANGYKVKAIAKGAFKNCAELTAVTLPESLETIDQDAFNRCYKLKAISIPASVKSVAAGAFYRCDAMTEVRIEDGTETLSLSHAYATGTNANSRGAFSETAVRTAYIGRNLSYNTDAYYGYGPFARCQDLEVVTFGYEVTRIGTNCFYKCPKLPSVTVGESVTVVGTSAFAECENLWDIALGKV